MKFAEAPRRDIDRPIANFRFFSPGYDEGIGLSLEVADSGGLYPVLELVAEVQRILRRTHSEVPILRVETLRQMLDEAKASRRFLTRLGVVFAAAATFLAALGIYGVVSLATARRRREMGKASKLARPSRWDWRPASCRHGAPRGWTPWWR